MPSLSKSAVVSCAMVLVVWCFICTDANRESSTETSLLVDVSNGETSSLTLLYPHPLPCRYTPGYTVGNRSRELQCCEKVEKDYTRHWSSSGSLTVYLETLRGWKCPQLTTECASPTFAFTQYSKLAYLRFCNQSELIRQCEPHLLGLTESGSSKSFNYSRRSESLQQWKRLTNSVNFSNVIDYSHPCTQVAMYDTATGGYGSYYEIIVTRVPFCSIATCGYDEAAVPNNYISVWNCISNTCRANIIVIMVALGILSIAVIISNITVLYVLLTSKKLRNSQAIYKMSLAVADLLVGVVVIPSFIATVCLVTMSRYHSTSSASVEGYRLDQVLETGYHAKSVVVNATVYSTFSLRRFPDAYIVTVGFFTSLSFVVSVYTLLLASIDRLYAISLPLKFRQGNPTAIAACAVLALWVIGVVIGILPQAVPRIGYGLVASVLVSFTGSEAVYAYIVTFGFPLVFVWITTLATHCASKHHSRVRKRLAHASNLNRFRRIDSRMAATLGLIVAAFSISIVPAALVLVLPLFITNIYFSKPNSLDPSAATAYNSAEFSSLIILAANSLWNCFIYGLRNQEFRLAAKLGYSRLFQSIGLTQLSYKLSSLVSNKHEEQSTSSVSANAATRPYHLSFQTVIVRLAPGNQERRRSQDVRFSESAQNQTTEFQS